MDSQGPWLCPIPWFMGKLAPDGKLAAVERPEQPRCPACGRYASYLTYCWLWDSEMCDDCRHRRTDRHLQGLDRA